MRSLQVQIRTALVDHVLRIASELGAFASLAIRADHVRWGGEGDLEGEWSVVIVNLPNHLVGHFVERVGRAAEDAQFVLAPVGMLPLRSPIEEVAAGVRDVSRLSTMELVLASLQSVGAWKGLAAYSVLAGIVGAYGLIFDVVYLLVAAMLINPMGAPLVVSVIGAAIGDVRVFVRGGLRFAASLGIQAVTALSLGFAYRLDVSTAMMEQVTSLSSWAVLIALASGAAGALTQIRSDRDSLISGSAAGFMVAAALAPPAAVLGLSIPLARWDYAGQMAFLLTLQFFAVAAGGWLVLAAAGVKPSDWSLGRGSARHRGLLVALLTVCVVVLVAGQNAQGAGFRKADLSRTALEIARDAVDAVPGVYHVQTTARFTRPDHARHNGETLLFTIVVEADRRAENEELASTIRAGIERGVRRRMDGVVPLVDVTLVPRAGSTSIAR
jgi:uncharacterized membrane protein